MIQIDGLHKNYVTKQATIHALDGIFLQVKQGEFVAITGASGSGKSTLLFTIGGMLRPSRGSVRINATDLYSLSNQHRAQFRGKTVGFIFQMFHLIPYLTVAENVLVSQSSQPRTTKDRVLPLLEQLGLLERAEHYPSELSAGEKQRTAIARAMIHKPPLILADEPTGNLDPLNEKEVLRHLSAYQQQGGTVVMVTHGSCAETVADRNLVLDHGKIVDSSFL
jgi:putative ABC transport system ATP-binding protein